MTPKQSAAMRILREVGKQGASVNCVAEATRIKVSDVARIFAILAQHNVLVVENNVARLSARFLKDVPLWKEMKAVVVCIADLR